MYGTHGICSSHPNFITNSNLPTYQNNNTTTHSPAIISSLHSHTNLPNKSDSFSINQPKMSLRLLTTRVAGPVLRTSASTRLFTTTAPFKKTATETAKETIEKANKTAGEAGVAAIEKGRTSFLPFLPILHSPSQLPSLPHQRSTSPISTSPP